MLSSIFQFVMDILGISGTDPEATGIVSQVFDSILALFGM